MNCEYKSLKVHPKRFWDGGNADLEQIDLELNALGAQGWELVSAFDTNAVKGTSQELVFVLKRRLQ